MSFPVESIREQFPALQRQINDRPVCHFDGPAGSQIPKQVASAMSDYLLNTNSNRSAPFIVSQESDERVDAGHSALADFLGTTDTGEIVFGQNMTSLTFALSRAIGKTWQSGDEIIVSQLDHDANVSPWVQAAKDAGIVVHHIPVNLEDYTLDQIAYRKLLSKRTKLVAVGYASNATGTVNPVKEMIAAAHEVGAITFIDAVHMAPHRRIDVTDLDCDFLCCSAYKFFGPHIGIMYGKRKLLESLPVYKLRPSPNSLPGRWMSGTQSHESICGAAAAVDYLANLGKTISSGTADRTSQINVAMQAISQHEIKLSKHFLNRLAELDALKLWGINDPNRWEERVPTFSFTHDSLSPQELARQLGEHGLLTWPGNHYAIPFTEAAGLEPEGTLRVGFLHYNTLEEVDRLVDSFQELL